MSIKGRNLERIKEDILWEKMPGRKFIRGRTSSGIKEDTLSVNALSEETP